MLKVGITGGIGSGKSLVCKLFTIIGIPVFEADSAARELMNSDPSLKEKLIQMLGPGIYTPEGTINRKFLAGMLFNDSELLKKVNSIVHPEVRKNFLAWTEEQTAPYVIHEAAILFETGFSGMMDFNGTVYAPESLRIKRVMERDGIPETEIRKRMQQQWTDEMKTQMSDFVIVNDNILMVIPQVLEIDKKLRNDGKIR